MEIRAWNYFIKDISYLPPDQSEFSLQDTLNDSKQHLGILLLLPQNLSDSQSQPVTRLKLTHPPVEVLFKLAKVKSSVIFQPLDWYSLSVPNNQCLHSPTILKKNILCTFSFKFLDLKSTTPFIWLIQMILPVRHCVTFKLWKSWKIKQRISLKVTHLFFG